MKRIVLLLAALLVLGTAVASAQEIVINNSRSKTIRASGKKVSETYDTGDFSGIRASAGIKVEVEKGASFVEVTTDRDVLEYLNVTVRNGVLQLGYRDNISVRNIETRVLVRIPDITSVSASSGATIKLRDQFGGNTLTMKASSAGSISGEVDFSDLKADASSGGSIKMEGRGKAVSAEASSGGSVNLIDYKAESAKISASSGGSVRVCATDSLTGSVSSGGSARYTGDPKNIDVRKSSGGSVGVQR